MKQDESFSDNRNNVFGPFQIQCELVKVSTLKKGSIKLEFQSQESQTAENRAKLMAGHEKVGWLWFGPELAKAEDIVNLPKIKEDDMYENLSKSQQLKMKLYKFFMTYNELHGRTFADKKEQRDAFQTFYNRQMEKLIELFEEKVESLVDEEGGDDEI